MATLAIVLLGIAAACRGGAIAPPSQDESEREPPAAAVELQVAGHLNVAAGPGHITDVWAGIALSGKSYAWLGSFDQPFCSTDITGVHIVDISDPANPTLAGFIPAPAHTRVNDVKVQRIRTSFFEGDLLVHSVEFCSGEDAPESHSPSQGVVLYDVTDPLSPLRLAPGLVLDYEVHNTFIFQQDERAYVLIVQDGGGRDLHILEVTDPSHPNEVAVLGRRDWPAIGPQSALGEVPVSFLHDVWAQAFPPGHPNAAYAGKTIAYLSYWDSGLVLLDITNPATPLFLGDSDYSDPDPLTGLRPEGNSHVAVPTADGELVFMGDEDFSTFQMVFSVDSGSFAGEYEAFETSFAARISEAAGRAMTGGTILVGTACSDAEVPAPPAGGTWIALVEDGGCAAGAKMERIAAAGYAGAILFGAAGSPGEVAVTEGQTPKAALPALFVSRPVAFAILGISPQSPAETPLPSPGARGADVTARATFDGWGYARILDVSDPTGIAEVGQFATGNALAEGSPAGVHSMHNAVLRERRAYIAWYGDGIRVVDFSDPASPAEVARFVDQAAGSDFWGVFLMEHPDGSTYILGSDRSTGLWLFRDPAI